MEYRCAGGEGVGVPGFGGDGSAGDEAGGGGLDELEGLGEEVFAGGEDDEGVAGGGGELGEGDGAGGAVAGGLAQVEGGAAGLAGGEAGVRLEEQDAGGLGGGHAADVEEFEVADVVPGEEGLAAGDLGEEGGVDAGGVLFFAGKGALEFGAGVVEAAEEAGVGKDAVVVGGEPGFLLGGLVPGVEERGEVGGFDGEERALRSDGGEGGGDGAGADGLADSLEGYGGGGGEEDGGGYL